MTKEQNNNNNDCIVLTSEHVPKITGKSLLFELIPETILHMSVFADVQIREVHVQSEFVAVGEQLWWALKILTVARNNLNRNVHVAFFVQLPF